MLNPDKKAPYRLFIIGAGFSKPAGLPLGVELLEQVRQEIKSYFQVHGWDGPLEEEIQEWKKIYPRKRISLESVLAYSHRKHFLHLNKPEEYYEHASRSIAIARQIIQEIIIKKTPTKIPQLYEDFANKLTSNDTILTFNYDTLLEDVFDSISKPYSLTPTWWLEWKEPYKETSDSVHKYLELIKLHGSIDWYDREYHDKTQIHLHNQGYDIPDDNPIFGENAYIPIELLNRNKIGDDLDYSILQRIVRVKSHKEYFQELKKYNSTVPFLLPPAYDKLLGSDPIRDIWENLHRTFDVYSSITIIGYSMPIYDEYAYEALGYLITNYQQRNNVNTTLGNRRVPVQIITKDSSETDALRKTPFLNKKKTRLWYEGFSSESLDWLDWG